MMQRTGDKNKAGHEAGVSEVIGVVLLIGIVVTAVAVVSVLLFSQSTPQKIPNINFMTGTDNSGNLYLYHNGGDNLTLGTFDVIVDNTPWSPGNIRVADNSKQWSLGKNLILSNVPSGSGSHAVTLVYNISGKGSTVIRSGSSGLAQLQKSILPEATPGFMGGSGGSPGAGYILNDAANISNSSYFTQAIQENVTANRINFYKNSLSPSGGLKLGTSISFKVTDTKKLSQIVYQSGSNTNLVTLNNTDIVTVSIQSKTQNFKVFGIAPQIWEMTASGADLTITRAAPVSSITATGVDISHTYLAAYNLIGSTLEIDTTGSSVTALTVNSTVYLPPPNTDSSDITITNAKPLPVGLFLLMIDNSQKTAYLVGTADTICWGTNCGPFGL
jgi:FlaG/FlaF family flagellin (archaellin)